MEWASDQPEPLLAIVAGLGGFWLRAQRMTDAVRYGLESIERYANEPPPSWYRAVASAGAALLNAGVKERVGPYRQTALALAREQGDETALVLLEMELMVDRVVEEGLTEPVLAYAHEVDARVGDRLRLRRRQHRVGPDPVPRARRPDRRRVVVRGERRAYLARAVLLEGHAAMMRGEFDRAAIALSEAAEIAAAGAARQERLVVASAGEWLEVLTGGAIPAPAGRADLANRVDVVGTWELMHAMASLRRLVLEREWGRVGDLADRELPFTTGTIRFEALLACVLMAAGRVADAAARRCPADRGGSPAVPAPVDRGAPGAGRVW